MWRVSDTLPDVVNADAPVGRQDLPLAGHLLGPLFLAELLPKAVGDAVAGDLVAVRVEALDQGVVCPLVTRIYRNLECVINNTYLFPV